MRTKLLLLVFFVALFSRLPFFQTVYWRTPDAVEYIDVARNIISGNGFVQTVRPNYVGDWSVITSAFHGRPVGTSIFIAGLLLINKDLYFVQLGFLLIGVLNCVLVFLLANKFMRKKWAAIVAILVAINPNYAITNRLLVSEILFMTFCYLALILFFRFKRKFGEIFLLGIFVGVAYLIRFEGIILFILLFAYSIFNRNYLRNRREFLTYFLGFLSITIFFFLQNYLVNGNPFFSYNYFHYQIKDFWSVIGSEFDYKFMTPFTFIKTNWQWIIGREVQIIFSHIKSFFGITFLGIFSIGVPLIFSIRKKPVMVLVLFSIATFLLYTSLWSGVFERERHFFGIYSLMLIVVFPLLFSRLPRNIAGLVLFITILVYSAYLGNRIYWARYVDTSIDNWTPVQKGELYAWTTKNVLPGEIAAATDPWLVNLFTQKATVRMPSRIDNRERLDSFVHRYQISYLFIDNVSEFEKIYLDKPTICLNKICVYKVKR
jgi:4-amino-4-deoxy-L-arabinose transferase-like glycosyltransferase